MTDKEKFIDMVNNAEVDCIDRNKVYWMRVDFPEGTSDDDRFAEMTHLLGYLRKKGLDQVIVSDASDMGIKLEDVTKYMNDHTSFDKLHSALLSKYREYMKKSEDTEADDYEVTRGIYEALDDILNSWGGQDDAGK